jgi:hypothetical protein
VSPIQRFTVTGSRNGSPVRIVWDQGRLAGDPPTIDLVLVLAAARAAVATDPMARRALSEVGGLSLEDAVQACELVCAVLDRLDEVDPAHLAAQAGVTPRFGRTGG